MLYQNDKDDSFVKGDDGTTDGKIIGVTNTDSLKVGVTTSALPTGASTAANQATEIASLASIDAGIPAGLGQTTMANSMPVVIPSDQTITLSSLSNRSEFSQYVVSGFGFTTSITSLTIGTAETKLVYLNNPSGSGKSIYIVSVFLATAIGQSNWAYFNLNISPTTSANGTAMTISNLLPGSGNASIGLCYSGPTTSASGVAVETYFYGAANTAPTNATGSIILEPYIVLPANSKFLITGFGKGASTSCNIKLKWFEA